jgi:hypothetical protein
MPRSRSGWAGQGDIDRSSRLLMELPHQFAHDGDQSALTRRLILSRIKGLASVVHSSTIMENDWPLRFVPF